MRKCSCDDTNLAEAVASELITHVGHHSGPLARALSAAREPSVADLALVTPATRHKRLAAAQLQTTS